MRAHPVGRDRERNLLFPGAEQRERDREESPQAEREQVVVGVAQAGRQQQGRQAASFLPFSFPFLLPAELEVSTVA